MLKLLDFLIHAIQPLLVPICFVFAWGLVFLIAWSLFGAIASSVHRAKQMHQIPCSSCTFFTSDYHLKCPVQPKIALSEEAIDCPDYRPQFVSWYDQINSQE